MEKYDKFRSSIEGSKQRSVCVTPLLSLNTSPPFNNKQVYKGDTHDKTLDYSTKDANVFKTNDDSLKRNLDKETNDADDDEYIYNPPLQNNNIKSQPQENLRV